jgi:hypothetical protein
MYRLRSISKHDYQNIRYLLYCPQLLPRLAQERVLQRARSLYAGL